MAASPPASEAERRAIEAPLGPVLVVAGPGAGKTRCLIERIRHLVERRGFAPEEICAVTFTNRAAEEIAQRLAQALGPAAAAVTRSTLHGLCVEILRQHGSAIGLVPGFGIADEVYQEAVLRRLGVWKKRRRGLLTEFGRRRLGGRQLAPRDEEVFQRYLAWLRQRHLVDFDDLIASTAELFERRPDLADQVAARWRYVLVDEGQDLDPAQYAIVRRLARGHRNLFVVGDDEQSIFTWRGADPAVLHRFQEDFGITEPIVLDQNRRCSQQIFETARRLLQANPSLFDKPIVAVRPSVHPVRAIGFPDEAEEARWVVADLVADRQRHGRALGDYAVLYRKHKLGHRLEQEFVAAGIPCRLAQGRALAEDEVIGQVVACLRLLLDPGDPAAQVALARRVFEEPLLDRLVSEAANGDFLAAVRRYARRQPKGDPDTRRAWRFVYQVENLSALARTHTDLRSVVAELLAQHLGPYRNVLEEHWDQLRDPAEDQAGRQLARKIARAVADRGRIWLAPAGGVEIALRGLLFGAGLSDVAYLEPGAPVDPSDAIVGPEDRGAGGLVLAVFKALQWLKTQDLDAGFEDYVAFDLETTDRDPETCDLVELAAVRVRGGVPVAEFHSLVRPARPISPQAADVHGYRDADVAAAPALADVWPRFVEFVGSDVLVAHNGQEFDVPVLRRLAGGLPGFERLAFYDTLPLARSLGPHGNRLADLAARFGIPQGRAHHALDDARALVGVFSTLQARRLARARISSLVHLLDWVAVGLALEPEARAAGEGAVLFDLASGFALGRYSDCLEQYARDRERLGRWQAPPVEELIERLGGRQRLERLRETPDPARRYPEATARLEALLAASAAPTLRESIQRLLDRVALSSSEADVAADRVNLLTLHATKGLEFDCVYIVGVEDGELLNAAPGREVLRREIEEARRLLYVGMTRARDRLILTCTARRGDLPGGGRRFLDEMHLVPEWMEPVTAS
jgi:superfamily I DNA/RNA helicase